MSQSLNENNSLKKILVNKAIKFLPSYKVKSIVHDKIKGNVLSKKYDMWVDSWPIAAF